MPFRQKSAKAYYQSPDFILRAFVILTLAIIISCGVYLYLFGIDFTNYLPHFSICPFRAITGIPCPGCGMTRAMLHLGQLKILKALALNLFSLPLLLAMVLCLLPGKILLGKKHRTLHLTILILMIIFWLLRIIY